MTSKSFLDGAKWRLFGGIFQKLTTFTLNQILLRNTSPEVFGIASIQLELLLSTILFLSREGTRMAVLRLPVDNTRNDYQIIINLSWLPTFLITMFLLCFAGHDIYISLFKFRSYISFSTSLLYVIGAWFESLAEPLFNLYQYNALAAPKVTAESVATLLRSVVTVFSLVLLDLGVYSFGLAQVTYGVSYCSVLVAYYPILNSISRKSDKHIQPFTSYSDFLFRPINESELSPLTTVYTEPQSNIIASTIYNRICNTVYTYIPSTALSAVVVTTGSSVLKHILTEADKIVLALFFTAYQQGIQYTSICVYYACIYLYYTAYLNNSVFCKVYITCMYPMYPHVSYMLYVYYLGIFAFANNYGSLIARLLFLPLEESCRVAFAGSINRLKMEVKMVEKEEEVVLVDSSDEHNNNRKVVNTDTAAHNHGNTTTPLPKSQSESQTPIHEQLDQLIWHDLYSQLTSLLLLLSRFGFLCMLFGPAYMDIVGKLLLSGKWYNSEVITTLQVYCIYLCALGLNGVLESFVHAACPAGQYYKVNISYIIGTCVYILSLYSIRNIGVIDTSGLILSSILSMMVRIVFCCHFIHLFFTSPRFVYDCIYTPTTIPIGMPAPVAVLKDKTEPLYEAIVLSYTNNKHRYCPIYTMIPNKYTEMTMLFTSYTLIYTSAYRYYTVINTDTVFTIRMLLNYKLWYTDNSGMYRAVISHICIGIAVFICLGLYYAHTIVYRRSTASKSGMK